MIRSTRGREQADREGRHTDQQQRDDQQLLASDDVAETSEHEPTDGPRHIADGVRRERKKGSGERIFTGEEDLRKDQCRGRRVDREVVPLECGAGEAGGESFDESGPVCGDDDRPPHRGGS